MQSDPALSTSVAETFFIWTGVANTFIGCINLNYNQSKINTV